MPRPTHVDIAEYQYDLPEDRIAKYPLVERDQSKLLVWKDGRITHSRFNQLAGLLPLNSLLFFNNTKVIPARILFEKETGGTIEVFLLHPAEGLPIDEALRTPSGCAWTCTIGNARRWTSGLKLRKVVENIELTATWNDRSQALVTFTWTPPGMTFNEVVERVGAVPLPPYLRREADTSDKTRYQTVYSAREGAVAAPTAGLHFTPAVLDELRSKGIATDTLTLHVSAGTFLPIKTTNAAEHTMHEEEVVVAKSNIINMLDKSKLIVAVGTTAMRTLESMYWYGVLLAQNPEADFDIPQDLPYREHPLNLDREEALRLVIRRMESLGVEELTGHTSIYLMPGYSFRITKGLITNFHQPGSTLLLLVSAFMGPAWKEIYNTALTEDYRFLSYGDSSLLLPLPRDLKPGLEGKPLIAC